MKSFILLSSLLIVSHAQQCEEGCRKGPVRLPDHICSCPPAPRETVSACIRYCCDDYLCRACDENPWYGIPSLCPYKLNKMDLSDSGSKYKFILEDVEVDGFTKGKAMDQSFFDPPTLEARASLFLYRLYIRTPYKVSGKFCGKKSVNSAGYLEIIFEDLVFDWHPFVELDNRCNITFLHINIEKSYSVLTTDKPVKFEFTEKNEKEDCKLTKCVNANWQDIFGKIKNKLQVYLANAATKYTNIILDQCPLSQIFPYPNFDNFFTAF